MAITVKHTKVSTVPDGDDTSVVRPSDWNADHQLVGTVPVANGGTGASTANDGLNALLPSQTSNTGKVLTTDGTNTSWSSNGVGDVVGPASATDNAIARFDTTTGKLIQNSIVTVSDTGSIAGVIEENFTPVTAPAYAEGRVFYDSTAKTLCYYNDNSQMTVNIGQEEIVRVRNQTGSTIPNGSVVYINGATGNTPTIALALANSFSTSDIIGVTTTDITNNGFGYATINGLVNGLDTSAFVEGDAVFLSATTPGGYTTTEPTRPNYSIQVGVILRANPSVGTLLVSVQIVSVETQHIIGTMAVDQGGTGQTSYTNGQLLIGNTTGNTLTKSTLTAGTGVSVTNGTGSITLANTGVTSAVAGTGISVSGATGAVTVTNTAPDQTVSLTAGTGISTSGTYPNFTITNTAPSSGGTVTSITAGTGLSGGTITSSGTIAIDSTVATLTGAQTLTNKTISGASNTLSNIGNSSLTNSAITINGTSTSLGGSISVGTVTSVTGTAPVVSSGGATPAISMPAATGSVNGYLTSTDWTTFNNKGSGTVTAVSVASANGFTGTSSGGATPALTLTTSITGMLKGNGTAISAGTAGSDYVAPATATSFTAQQYFGNVALTDGATISWAANTAQVATFTFVSSNRTMGAPTGLVSGAYYGLAVIQNSGSNTLTWNSVFKWAGGTAPTLSTAASAKDYFVFRTDGTNLYEQGRSLGVA